MSTVSLLSPTSLSFTHVDEDGGCIFFQVIRGTDAQAVTCTQQQQILDLLNRKWEEERERKYV